MDKIAIVIVTYKRQQLLRNLLDSLLILSMPPWRVVIVDNDNDPEVEELVESYSSKVECGLTPQTWPEGNRSFVYVGQQENTGGSGGFSKGVEVAYHLGAEWFWLMDDDVVVMSDALEKLARWMPCFDVIQGSRLDYDGGPFYWQYHFLEHLAIYNPLAPASLGDEGFKKANAACFEGGLFKRSVVDQIGFPDYRFFVYWDDCIYGYLASKRTSVVVVSDIILQRTHEIKNWEVTGTRQLNSSSDTTRFYIMRNRGYMARYLKLNGDYNPVAYAIGTFLSFAKEFIRLISVDRENFSTGTKNLFRGWRQSHVLIHDPNWEPMPKPCDQESHFNQET